MLNYVFGLNGRLGRLGWWLLTSLVVPGIMLLGVIPLVGSAESLKGLSETQQQILVHAITNWNMDRVEALTSPAFANALHIFVGFVIVAQWISFSATFRRFHDRNKSGVWYFISLIPIIGPIWLLIECGFMSSVDIGNAYDRVSGDQIESKVFKSLSESLDAEIALRRSVDGLKVDVSSTKPKAKASQNRPQTQLVTHGAGPRTSFGRRRTV